MSYIIIRFINSLFYRCIIIKMFSCLKMSEHICLIIGKKKPSGSHNVHGSERYSRSYASKRYVEINFRMGEYHRHFLIIINFSAVMCLSKLIVRICIVIHAVSVCQPRDNLLPVKKCYSRCNIIIRVHSPFTCQTAVGYFVRHNISNSGDNVIT